jgi:transposase-like protein
VTDAVLDEVAAWQGAPLEPLYPVVFFDALRVKVRDEGMVRLSHPLISLGTQKNRPAIGAIPERIA